MDAALPRGGRLRLPDDLGLDRAVSRQLGRRRKVLTGVTAFLALVAAGIVGIQASGSDDQPLVSRQVAVGTTVAPANGSTVTVSNVRQGKVPGVTSPVLLARVKFCGGGPTVDESTSADARNYIAPDKFSLDGTPNNQLRVTPAGTAWLQPTQLARGDCTSGTIGFEVPPDVKDVGRSDAFVP
ncbi:hypothetical protein GCM10009841_08320 [Microlunatus panaciterrae]